MTGLIELLLGVAMLLVALFGPPESQTDCLVVGAMFLVLARLTQMRASLIAIEEALLEELLLARGQRAEQ